jgi:hypothetical protein
MPDLTEVILTKHRLCQTHIGGEPPVATYDAMTDNGQWAYMCDECFPIHRMHSTLGTGKGQHIKYNIGPLHDGR